MEVSDQLQLLAALRPQKCPLYPLNERLGTEINRLIFLCVNGIESDILYEYSSIILHYRYFNTI